MLDIDSGGKYFVSITYCAKRMKWINMMLPHKDAELIFGDKVGSKNNYNAQRNNIEDISESELHGIRKTLMDKYNAMQKKFPSEKSMMDEAL